MQWLLSESTQTRNISDGVNYDVREPFSGATRGESIGMLRVRTLRVDDLGLYQCQVQCVEDSGVKKTTSKAVEICLQHSHADYGKIRAQKCRFFAI
jgi:hypothetical protein